MSDNQDNLHLPWNHKQSNFQDVQDFHDKIGYRGLVTAVSSEPHFLPESQTDHRVKFLLEELNEFEQACADGDLETAFDSLIDLVYVALGTADWMCLPWEEGWKRVHAANMLKEAGTKPGRSGGPDAIKPAGWTAPDLSDLVTPYLEDEQICVCGHHSDQHHDPTDRCLVTSCSCQQWTAKTREE